MNLENFISEALCHPTDYVSYYVSRRLAELFPEKAIIEGNSCAFDLEAFVRAGHCSVIKDESVHNQIETTWEDDERKALISWQNAVLNVLWRDSLLDIFLITFAHERYKSRHYWIIADASEIAESFFRSVCEWRAEVRGEILVFDGGEWQKNEELFRAIRGASFDN